MSEEGHGSTAVVLGATGPLGSAVLRHLATSGSDPIIAAERAADLPALKSLLLTLGSDASRVTPAAFDPDADDLALVPALRNRITRDAGLVLQLATARDRSAASSAIRATNRSLTRGTLELVRACTALRSLVVLSDVGIAGDYPGRFYESWADVGQEPFDAVDESALESEVALTAAPDVPSVRARVGLLVAPERRRTRRPGQRDAGGELIPWLSVVKRLPRFVTIPSAVTEGCLAPLTPIDWCAAALAELGSRPEAQGQAFHLVLGDAPPMTDLLALASNAAGGGRVKGGLPTGLVGTLGHIPGMREAARKQTDNVSSWLTPHRYCLSRNDLDITAALRQLSPRLGIPSWTEQRAHFIDRTDCNFTLI